MTSILLIGCGKMGGALLGGWLDGGLSPSEIVVVDPAAAAWPTPAGKPLVVGGVAAIPDDFHPEVVVVAVKPQMIAGLLPDYGRFAAGAVVLSIVAGKTLAGLDQLLGGQAAVVRAMPNTPAAVRRGITAAVANSRVSAAQRQLCGELLAAVGEVAWVEEESLIDAVTAVSGSGPAYVFLLAEALAEAGIAAGLPTDLAASLARATVAGSGELLRQSADSPAQLRQNVTSPGGTTFAALQVLMAEDGLSPLLRRAVEAAARRSRELAG